MTYNSKTNTIILFGGDTDGTQGTDDTWVYFFSNNTWVKLNLSIKPSPRLACAMDYDSKSDTVILFSGVSYKGGSRNQETWIFNLSQNDKSTSSEISLIPSTTKSSNNVPGFEWFIFFTLLISFKISRRKNQILKSPNH